MLIHLRDAQTQRETPLSEPRLIYKAIKSLWGVDPTLDLISSVD